MLIEPHPINGMEYADQGDGVVKVTDHKSGRWGRFRYDGVWLEGELSHADPHFLLFIGGPKLPPEMDIFYAMAPLPLDSNAAQAGYGIQPTESDDAPQMERSVLMYVGDPGVETDKGMRSSAYVDQQYILDNDRRPELVPDVYRLENPMQGGPEKIPTDRFHEQKFHDLEVERIWKKTWQMVCREEDIPGVYYNSAAVIDADGSYLGKYRKHHIPHCLPGFWEKFYFRPGNLGYPVFQTAYAKIGVYICYDRHFPEGARALGLNGAEIVFNPSATVAGLSEYLWKLEQPAHAAANGYFIGAINRVGTEAPWNIGEFYGQSYFADPRGQIVSQGSRDQDELIVADLDLDKIREVRNIWQFYRDRRPDSYGDLVAP